MTLTAGSRLGAYEITALIGAGGMGEVYRARDTKLNRDVALKILPELFAADPDRLARFKREAQLLASLNHPNIAAIYGFEESAGSDALVLELVDGATLADRSAQGPMPLDEVLPIARQIAEALEAAHEHGVIHRDLKPANIKVRPDGMVKVLDFGLAKAFEGDVAAPDVSQSPTLSVAATYMGVILGTAAYMAPEQAKGKRVDKRADIWAFGCVLYEMLTGRRALDGEDISEILASVIKGSANLDLLPAPVHPRVRDVIARCLEKDVRKRFRDIGDVQYELEQIQKDPGGTQSQPSAAIRQPHTKPLLLGIGGAVVVTALVAGGAVWVLKPPPPGDPRPAARFSYTLPQNQVLRNLGIRDLRVFRDLRGCLSSECVLDSELHDALIAGRSLDPAEVPRAEDIPPVAPTAAPSIYRAAASARSFASCSLKMRSLRRMISWHATGSKNGFGRSPVSSRCIFCDNAKLWPWGSV